MNRPDDASYRIEDLLRVMQRLRDPQHGCPWDLQQDFATIVPSTLEEAYELVEAIEHGDFGHVAEELGDLMFQVVFYAQMGQERGLFDFPQIIHTLVDKLVRRHPHVFAGGAIEGVVDGDASVAEVKQSWEAIKREERAARQQHSVLDDIPLALPALSRAQKVQKRAATVGFDWPDLDGVLAKLHEELAELTQAMNTEGDTAARKQQVEGELGDLLFSCVNMARRNGIDAEAALRRATTKFEGRFNAVEARLEERGERVEDTPLDVLDQLWEEVKRDAREPHGDA
ncbi:MAG: nucleoside triphosphate pyrophosphohydrolase [Halieaceae bacterium]|nr:nucleoside triphosphate pyrophosphohydrolase [Halieaceae bacterium]